MNDPTLATWQREKDLLLQLRELLEENKRLREDSIYTSPPAQIKPVFSYTPDMDAVRRDEKEKADKFLAQQDQHIKEMARAIKGITGETK